MLGLGKGGVPCWDMVGDVLYEEFELVYEYGILCVIESCKAG